MLPGLIVKVFLSYRHSTATFHPLKYPDRYESYTVTARYVVCLSSGWKHETLNKCIQGLKCINRDSRVKKIFVKSRGLS